MANQTSKPGTPQQASNGKNGDDTGQGPATADQVESIRQLLTEMKTEQQALWQSLEAKNENAKQEVNGTIDSQFKQLKDEFTLEIAGLTNRMTSIEDRLVEL